MKYLILLFLISGCASFGQPNGIYSNIEFKAYTNYYLELKDEYLGTRKVNAAINIYFGSFTKPTLARCTKWITNDITIDQVYWQKITDEERILLLFHELGHCDLNLYHQESELGIMNSKTTLKTYTQENMFNLFLRGI